MRGGPPGRRLEFREHPAHPLVVLVPVRSVAYFVCAHGNGQQVLPFNAIESIPEQASGDERIVEGEAELENLVRVFCVRVEELSPNEP